MTTASDNFDRPAETPLDNGTWESVLNSGIDSDGDTLGVALPDLVFRASRWRPAVTLFTPDQYAEVVVTAYNNTGKSDHVAAAVRVGADGSYYAFAATDEFFDNTFILYKYTGGSETSLGAYAAPTPMPVTLRLAAVGQLLTATIDGATVLTATDAELTGGQPGVAGVRGSTAPRPSLVTSWAAASLGDHPAADKPACGVLKKIIDAVWPRGSAWMPKPGGGMDGLLCGISDTLETAWNKISTLANIRNPKKTEQLDELEIDFGITPEPSLADASRRDRLSAKINSEPAAGPRDRLERELNSAGFSGLFVYSNSPAVNPALFLTKYKMVAGGGNAFAGNSNAVAGKSSFSALVNGRIIRTINKYRMVAGGGNAFAGNSNSVAGITGSDELLYQYDVPVNPENWPFVFFVGGAARRLAAAVSYYR